MKHVHPRPFAIQRLGPEWQEAWGERAAIIEYDGNVPHGQAEEAATKLILAQARLAETNTELGQRSLKYGVSRLGDGEVSGGVP